VFCGVRQHGQITGALDGTRQFSLMPGTETRLASWLDLAAIGDEPLKHIRLLVVDLIYTVGAEFTPLAPSATSLSVCQ